MKTILSFVGSCALVLAAGAGVLAHPDFDTLIAHRGESKDAPENTLPAYQMAVDRGFGFECDVYLSSDKRVFSFHDANLKRTTGVDMPCCKASWAETVSKIDAGKWKGDKWIGTRPALLEEILALARDGRQIYIEVKGGSTEVVPYIKDILAKQTTATPKNVLFIAFSKDVCKALKKEMPTYRTYWLTDSHLREKNAQGKRVITGPMPVENVIATLKDLGVDGVDQQFDPKVITPEYVAKVRAAGFEYHSWTIDVLDKALKAFGCGAQTVTTNCAKKLRDEYEAGGAK